MRPGWRVSFLLAVSFAASADAQDLGKITGRVLSSTGEPVRKATVRVQGAGNTTVNGRSTPQIYIEISGPDGSFTFADMPPGRYTALAEKTGYAVGRPPGPIDVTAGKTAGGIEMTLTPQAVLSGRVLDEDGDPMPMARITIQRYSWDANGRVLQNSGSGMADDRGEFRIPNIQPGRYLVQAQDSLQTRANAQTAIRLGANAQMVPLPTYYPSETDARRALAIDAKAGQEAQGIQIRLRRDRTYTVRGHVAAQSNEPANGNLILFRTDDSSMQSVMSTSVRGAEQEFRLAGVPAGRYTLQFTSNPPNREAQGQSGSMEVLVAGDVEGLVMPVSPNLTVTGRITLEGGDLASLINSARGATPAGAARQGSAVSRAEAELRAALRLNVMLSTTGARARNSRSGAAAEDGTFTITNVLPGKHLLSVPLFQGVYLKSVRAGGMDLMGGPLDLSRGGVGPLEIVLAKGAAQVSLAALPDPADPAASRTTLLWLQTPNGLMQSAGIVAVPPQAANMTVPPGEYFLATFEGAEAAALHSLAVLRLFEDKAAKASLKDGAMSTLESVVIGRDAFEAALAAMP